MNKTFQRVVMFMTAHLLLFSLFVELKGRSKEEAFQIGNEIVEAVTAANPNPIKLVFEKVSYTCVIILYSNFLEFF